jgi:hypothetical protein
LRDRRDFQEERREDVLAARDERRNDQAGWRNCPTREPGRSARGSTGDARRTTARTQRRPGRAGAGAGRGAGRPRGARARKAERTTDRERRQDQAGSGRLCQGQASDGEGRAGQARREAARGRETGWCDRTGAPARCRCSADKDGRQTGRETDVGEAEAGSDRLRR